MTRKALISGMIAGLLLSVGLLYPIFVQYVFVSPQWFGVDTRTAATMPGMLLSGMLTLLGFLTMGILPVVRAGITSWSQGAKAGSLS